MEPNELIEKITAAEQSAKSAHHRIDELHGEVADFKEAYQKMGEMVVEMKYMRQDLNKMMTTAAEVKERPIRKFDHIINALITAVIAALVSYFLK